MTNEHREQAREPQWQIVEMLPCPFCGHTVIEVAGNDWEEGFKATCIGCLAKTGRYRTRPVAIEAWNNRALSVRDQEIKEVLEGLATHQIRSRRPCWCPPDYESEQHSAACLAARALWEKVNHST